MTHWEATAQVAKHDRPAEDAPSRFGELTLTALGLFCVATAALAQVTAQAAPTPLCGESSDSKGCWLPLENTPGCHLWLPVLSAELDSTYSFEGEAECADGRLSGTGKLSRRFTAGFRFEATGTFVNGRQEGRFVEDITQSGSASDFSLNRKSVGRYVAGERHGTWEETADSHRTVRTFERGQLHGSFSRASTSPRRGGHQIEGRYSDGKPTGVWVTRYGDGGSEEVAYAAGMRHGESGRCRRPAIPGAWPGATASRGPASLRASATATGPWKRAQPMPMDW